MLVLFGSVRLIVKLADGKVQLSMMTIFIVIAIVNSRI